MNAVKQFVKNPNYYKELQTDLADTLYRMVVSEDADWRKGWRPNQNENIFPINVETKNSYNGMNIWLLWGKSPSNLWGTFNCWFKLGGGVKKKIGNKWTIVKPSKYKVRKGETHSKVYYFEVANKPILDENKQPSRNEKGEVEYRSYWNIGHHRVFCAEQIEGFAIPKNDTSHLDNSIKPIERCKKFFNNLNAKVIYDGSKCFYRPSTDEIGMPKIEQFENAEEYYSVFAHEHIHWSGDDRRLKRNKVSYAEEELVAEIGSFLTSVHLGIQSTPKPNNLAYLKHWSNGDINKKKIFSALSDASKSLEYLKELQTKKEKKVA